MTQFWPQFVYLCQSSWETSPCTYPNSIYHHNSSAKQMENLWLWLFWSNVILHCQFGSTLSHCCPTWYLRRCQRISLWKGYLVQYTILIFCSSTQNGSPGTGINFCHFTSTLLWGFAWGLRLRWGVHPNSKWNLGFHPRWDIFGWFRSIDWLRWSIAQWSVRYRKLRCFWS